MQISQSIRYDLTTETPADQQDDQIVSNSVEKAIKSFNTHVFHIGTRHALSLTADSSYKVAAQEVPSSTVVGNLTL